MTVLAGGTLMVVVVDHFSPRRASLQRKRVRMIAERPENVYIDSL